MICIVLTVFSPDLGRKNLRRRNWGGEDYSFSSRRRTMVSSCFPWALSAFVIAFVWTVIFVLLNLMWSSWIWDKPKCILSFRYLDRLNQASLEKGRSERCTDLCPHNIPGGFLFLHRFACLFFFQHWFNIQRWSMHPVLLETKSNAVERAFTSNAVNPWFFKCWIRISSPVWLGLPAYPGENKRVQRSCAGSVAAHLFQGRAVCWQNSECVLAITVL